MSLGLRRGAHAEQADLGLERDSVPLADAGTGHRHQRQHVVRTRGRAVHDEVAALDGDFGAVDALAPHPDRVDEALGRLPRRVLPDIASRGQGEGLGRLPRLHAQLDIALDLAYRSPDQAQPAAREDRARRQVELRRGMRHVAILAEGPVAVDVVDGRAEVEDRAVARARVHGQRAADGRGNARQALEPAHVARRRLADEPGERHAGADRHLFALELGPAQDPAELQHDAVDRLVGEEHVIAAAQHHQRQPLLGGEGQRVANIVQILGDDEELGGTADSQ